MLRPDAAGLPTSIGADQRLRHWMREFPGTAAGLGFVNDGSWRSHPADRVAPGDRNAGVWVAAVEMPTDAVGQGLWLASRRVPIGWLLDPPYRPESSDSPGAAPPESHDDLLASLGPALNSPLLRWRARIALRAAGYPGWRTAGRTDDPIVERLAQQIEDEWSFGLEWLSVAQPELAERLRSRLAGLLVLASTPQQPVTSAIVAWDPDVGGLEAIKGALLQSRESAADRLRRIDEWLAGAPTQCAWVIDDAGLSDPVRRRSIGTVGLALLSGGGARDQTAAAFAAMESATAAPTVFGLAPGRMASAVVIADESGSVATQASQRSMTESKGRAAFARVGIGDWEASRSVLAGSPTARPPGFAIGPLLPDWTLETWWQHALPRREGPLPLPASPAFAAVLMHDPERGEGIQSGWVLYMEAELPQTATRPVGPDEVRVWIGPPYAPRLTCTVRSDGSVERSGPLANSVTAEVVAWSPTSSAATTPVRTNGSSPEHEADAEQSAADAPTTNAALTPQMQRWSAWISLPLGCIDSAIATTPGGQSTLSTSLRLGIERADPLGRHSAWPRPMVPWQAEPGRLWIDLSDWDGLSSRR